MGANAPEDLQWAPVGVDRGRRSRGAGRYESALKRERKLALTRLSMACHSKGPILWIVTSSHRMYRLVNVINQVHR